MPRPRARRHARRPGWKSGKAACQPMRPRHGPAPCLLRKRAGVVHEDQRQELPACGGSAHRESRPRARYAASTTARSPPWRNVTGAAGPRRRGAAPKATSAASTGCRCWSLGKVSAHKPEVGGRRRPSASAQNALCTGGRRSPRDRFAVARLRSSGACAGHALEQRAPSRASAFASAARPPLGAVDLSSCRNW
ncbi:hypothetical protein FQR65_LT20052 [Abscondita terminalis]|nr:hypothetical protein FQR65_LT20052 [Abscondita terminalis]